MSTHFYQQELEKLIQRADQHLIVYQSSLQKTIDQFSYLPAILAEDPRVAQSLSDEFDPQQLSTILAKMRQRSGAEEIFIMNTDGEAVASANHLSDHNFVGNNYAFRPYFQTAISGQPGFYFAVGTTTGTPGLFLAEPIFDQEQVIGVVVVKLSLDEIRQIWAHSGDKIWLTDKLGIIFLSYDSQWLYQTTRPLSVESQEDLQRTRQYADYPIRAMQVISHHSDYSRVVLGQEGEHIVFQQELNAQGWKVNWLFSEKTLRSQVNLKKLYASSLFFLLLIALLWMRARTLVQRTEQQLHQQALINDVRQRALIDSTDAGLINLDVDGNITFINAQARQLFRLSDNTLPAIGDLITPWRGIQASIQANDAVGIRCDGTHVPILVSTSLVGINDHDEYLVTVHDVSELKQAQLELQRSYEELEQRVQARTEALRSTERELFQAQRLASIGRMSAAIAHELNQPISALASYVTNSKRIAQKNPEANQLVENLAQISALTERLSRISRQLKLVSEKRDISPSEIRILPLVLYAQDVLLQKSEQADVRVSVIISTDDQAFANSMLLEQALVNLLSYAIDATTGQPVRTVTFFSQKNECYELKIHNTGHALTEDEINNLFEPFYSLRPEKNQFDLGLAISYNLILDMGGKLSVDSSSDSGTTFTIRLPLSEE